MLRAAGDEVKQWLFSASGTAQNSLLPKNLAAFKQHPPGCHVAPRQPTARIDYGEFESEEVGIMKGRLAPSSLVELERTLKLFGKMCGNRKLAQISPKLVEQFFAQRLGQVKAATANKELRTL